MQTFKDILKQIRRPFYRIRGFFRYGIFKALSLYIKVKKNQSKPLYKLSICAIAKNEGKYFVEWIEYHKLVGAEKFYIYDNESTDNTKEILQPYMDSGIVEYTYRKGAKQQLPVYADCLERFRFDTEWIAFIDLDEFIVPVEHKNIQTFLQNFKDCSAVQINWICYGSAGKKAEEPGLVMEKFKDHSELDFVQNRHIKSIVRPQRTLNFSGAHECVPLFGKILNAKGEVVRKSHKSMPPIGQDIMRINHYAVKSFEECTEKRYKGEARHGKKVRPSSYFNRFDRNDIKNDGIMDEYIARLKKINNGRQKESN